MSLHIANLSLSCYHRRMNVKHLPRSLVEKILSPKTAAFIKLGIAVLGVITALKELRDADKRGFEFYDSDDAV